MSTHPALITHISWGEIEISLGAKKLQFKDCKVWPEDAKEWDWNLTGTHHRPGIQPADIQEILDQEVEAMILSKGMLRMLHTSKETIELLDSLKLKYHIEETKKAANLFNELTRQGVRTGGIFHSTC